MTAAPFEYVASFCAACAIVSFVFAVFGLLLGLVFHKKRVTRHLIQQTALVCLCMTPCLLLAAGSVVSSIDGTSSSHDNYQPIASRENSEPASSLGESQNNFVFAPLMANRHQRQLSKLQDEMVKSWSSHALVKWTMIGLISLWLGGILISLISLCRSIIALRKLVLNSKPIADPAVEAALNSAASSFCFRMLPEIRSSEHVDEPQIAGLFRSVILLPANNNHRENHWCKDQVSLEQVLTHELAHVARRDQITVIVQQFVLAIYWWNSLVHRLVKRLKETRELLCDNYVLQRHECVSYGETLLRFAIEKRSPPAGLTTAISGPVGSLERRIVELVNPNRDLSTRSGITGRFLVFFFFTALCVLISMATGPALSSAETQVARQAGFPKSLHRQIRNSNRSGLLDETGTDDLVQIHKTTADQIEISLHDQKLMAIELENVGRCKVDVTGNDLTIVDSDGACQLKIEIDWIQLSSQIRDQPGRRSAIHASCTLSFSSEDGFLARFKLLPPRKTLATRPRTNTDQVKWGNMLSGHGGGKRVKIRY